MNPSEWFLLIFGISFLWFWVEFGDKIGEEETAKKKKYHYPDTNNEDLEIIKKQ